MLSKQQRIIADQLMRSAAVERLHLMGAPVNPDTIRSNYKPAYIAKLINQYAGLPIVEDPMVTVRAFATDRPVDAAPSREANYKDRPPMAYLPAFIVAANRARAAQPRMMSMCGLREGRDG